MSIGLISSAEKLPRHLRQLKTMMIVVAILGLAGCSDDAAESEPGTTSIAVPVRTSAVTVSAEQAWLRFAGVARTRQRAALTFQVGGVLTQRSVEIGQQVTAGQVLMILYNPTLQPAAEAAKHRHTQLETERLQAYNELIRLQTLHQRGVIPRQELEQQQSRVDALVAAVEHAAASHEQAQQLLSETQLLAPFAGVVEAVLAEPGEYAQPGQAVLRLSSVERIEAEIRVPAHLTHALEVGQQLPVWSSLQPNQTTTAAIVEIGQSNSEGIALYPVIVTLENASVRAGEALEVGVPQHREAALVAPLSAIMRSAEGLTVFRVNNNRVQRLRVDVEQLQGELAVLAPGSVNAGDELVYAGLTRLADGDRVEVLP